MTEEINTWIGVLSCDQDYDGITLARYLHLVYRAWEVFLQTQTLNNASTSDHRIASSFAQKHQGLLALLAAVCASYSCTSLWPLKESTKLPTVHAQKKEGRYSAAVVPPLLRLILAFACAPRGEVEHNERDIRSRAAANYWVSECLRRIVSAHGDLLATLRILAHSFEQVGHLQELVQAIEGEDAEKEQGLKATSEGRMLVVASERCANLTWLSTHHPSLAASLGVSQGTVSDVSLRVAHACIGYLDRHLSSRQCSHEIVDLMTRLAAHVTLATARYLLPSKHSPPFTSTSPNSDPDMISEITLCELTLPGRTVTKTQPIKQDSSSSAQNEQPSPQNSRTQETQERAQDHNNLLQLEFLDTLDSVCEEPVTADRDCWLCRLVATNVPSGTHKVQGVSDELSRDLNEIDNVAKKASDRGQVMTETEKEQGSKLQELLLPLYSLFPRLLPDLVLWLATKEEVLLHGPWPSLLLGGALADQSAPEENMKDSEVEQTGQSRREQAEGRQLPAVAQVSAEVWLSGHFALRDALTCCASSRHIPIRLVRIFGAYCQTAPLDLKSMAGLNETGGWCSVLDLPPSSQALPQFLAACKEINTLPLPPFNAWARHSVVHDLGTTHVLPLSNTGCTWRNFRPPNSVREEETDSEEWEIEEDLEEDMFHNLMKLHQFNCSPLPQVNSIAISLPPVETVAVSSRLSRKPSNPVFNATAGSIQIKTCRNQEWIALARSDGWLTFAMQLAIDNNPVHSQASADCRRLLMWFFAALELDLAPVIPTPPFNITPKKRHVETKADLRHHSPEPSSEIAHQPIHLGTSSSSELRCDISGYSSCSGTSVKSANDPKQTLHVAELTAVSRNTDTDKLYKTITYEETKPESASVRSRLSLSKRRKT